MEATSDISIPCQTKRYRPVKPPQSIMLPIQNHQASQLHIESILSTENFLSRARSSASPYKPSKSDFTALTFHHHLHISISESLPMSNSDNIDPVENNNMELATAEGQDNMHEMEESVAVNSGDGKSSTFHRRHTELIYIPQPPNRTRHQR